MESLYYVMCWACHRKCKHCYETRFRPYVRDALRGVVDEAKAAFPRIVANMPERHTYLDLSSASETLPAGYEEKAGRIILAGGEVLVDPVREEVLYPVLEAIQAKYAAQAAEGLPVRVIVQTTGDLVTPEIVDDLLSRGAWMISCAGMDDFHVGMEGDKRVPLQEKLRNMFEAAGMRDSALPVAERNWKGPASNSAEQPVYSFFGATEDAWIGKIWPRGRAWENSLSRAEITDNFCNAWSGGLNFLNWGYSGSEVSIDPNGDVFPCCLKTKAPLGNLTEEPLEGIIRSLAGHPALEALSMGHPERMGLSHGWDVATFLEKSRTTRPDGAPYRNLCIGCDRFHEDVLAPILGEIRARRLGQRAAAE
ncbi:MAG: radical SAM/SPASM domain-containing protein [Pseudomonadota bacterium]